MGSRKSHEVGSDGKVQGIGIHDPRIQHANLAPVGAGAASDYTEQGVRAGVPEPSGRSNMVLKGSGSQTERTSYTVQTRSAGHPIPSDGSFIWYDDNNDAEHQKPYGHDGYQVITGINTSIQNKAVTDPYVRPDIVRLHNDYLFVVKVNSASQLGTFSYNPQAGIWTGGSQIVAGSLSTSSSVGLFALPSGRMVCVFSDGHTGQQVHAVASDDNGGSWFNYTNSALNKKTSETISDIAISYSAGVVLMFTAEVAANGAVKMEQWISYDLGCTFDRVGSEFGSATGALGRTAEEAFSPCVEGLDNGSFMIAYADKGSGLGSGLARYFVGVIDPAEPAYLQNLSYISNHGSGICTHTVEEEAATCWVWRDEDRTCYFLGNFSSAGNINTAIQRSEDGGNTWLKYEAAAVYYQKNMSARKIAANSVGGRAVMLSFFDGAHLGEEEEITGFADEARIFWIYLGGHSRAVTINGYDNGSQRFNPTDMLAWSTEGAASLTGTQDRSGGAWLSCAAPDSCGWTQTASGTNSSAFETTTGTLAVSTGTGVRGWSIINSTGFKHQETLAFAFKVTVASGGDRTDLDCGVELEIANYDSASTTNATAVHRVVIGLDSAGFQVREPTAPATIATVDYDLTKPTWFFVALKTSDTTSDQGEVAVWYGPDAEPPTGAGGLGTQRRNLTNACIHGTLANIYSSNLTAKGYVKWGHIQSGTAASRWEMVNYSFAAGPWAARLASNYVSAHRAYPDSSPAATQTCLNGREWSTVPALLIDQVRMSAGDGPAKLEDSWVIKPKFDYGIENLDILNNASPRLPWRSKQETAGATMTAQRITWDMESSTPTQEIEFGNYAIVVLLLGCNFKSAKLQERDHSGGGAWEDICDLDAAVDLAGLSFTRRGACIFPNFSASGSSAKWIQRNSLQGCTVDLGSGGGLNQYKHVRGNTEGGWYVDGTGTKHTRVPRVYYETDELTASDPASGTAAVWKQNFGCILLNKDSSGIDQTISLYIPAQANADGYLQIGSVLIGEVAVFGHQYDRGMSVRTVANVQDFTRPDGSRRPHILGPVRRAVEFSWSETAVDASSIQGGLNSAHETLPGSANSPDWVGGTVASNHPIASTRDAVSLMDGILREVGGSSQPVTFLPRIPLKAGSAEQAIPFNDDSLFVYGRIDSDHSYSVVQGNEGVDEVQRLNTITITEEV